MFDKKAYMKEYYAAHKVERAAYDKVYQKTYQAANKAAIATTKKAYRAAHKVIIAAREKAWRDTNKTTIRARDKTYRDTNKVARRAAHQLKWYDGRNCQECGKPMKDWHHVDPSTKLRDVGSMCWCSDALIQAEIGKCIPLCASCHRKLHRIEEQS